MSRLIAGARRRASLTLYPPGDKMVLHRRTGSLEMLVLVNEDVGRSIYSASNYEVEETSALTKLLRVDDVCLDVGANIGYFSLKMASVATRGAVHAFEPIELNIALLRASAALNGFEHITSERAAVGASPGLASFSVATDSAYSSLKATGRKAEAAATEVPVLTLDGYIASRALSRVDVIKIDVEGAEAEVLAGARNLFSDPLLRPRVVFIELFDLNLAAFGTDARAVAHTLGEYGYEPHVAQCGELRPIKAPSTRQYNYFFVDTARR